MSNKKIKVSNVPNLRFPGFEGGWEEKKLLDVAPLQRGFDLPINDIKKGNFPVVFSNGILKFHNEFKIKAPGVVTGRSGTIGKVTFVEKDYWPHNTSLWVTDFKNNVPKFIYHFYSRYKLERFGTGSGVPTLNRNDIHIQKEYFPKSDEQQKIASFLSLIDERIATQNKIIEQLETLIKGLSEKLFSRKIRFKGFTDKWELKNLGEICEFHKGNPLSKSSIIKDGNLKCIHYGELFITYKAVISDIVSLTNNDGFKSKIGDILMPSSDVTPLGLATASVLLEDNVVLGGDINILRPRSSINPVFLSYLLNSEKKKIIELVSGTTIKHIYSKDLKKIKVNIPDVQEQTKIAKLLSSIDTKIEAETNLLDKYQSQKQYLLKNLFI
jgi:type I restriction enzyme S subunit